MSTVLSSWALCVALVSYEAWGGHGNPQIDSQLVRSAGGLGPPKWGWHQSKHRSCREAGPYLVGSVLTLRG